MISTQQQLDALARLARPGSFALIASAGSGKTTTIGLLARECSRSEITLALAFNRESASGFAAKLPYWVQSSTFHAKCKSAVDASSAKQPKVSADKLKWLAKDNGLAGASLLKLTALLKQQEPNALLSQDEVLDLADYYGIDATGDTVRNALDLLKLSDEDTSRMDFDDMLRFAARPKVVFAQAHTIFLDEAQDTNGLQRALLRKMLRADGRAVLVGDPNQSIYGFRGADADALTRLCEDFHADTLPLSISWRCSRAVVEEARKILQQ